jgi:acetyl esterase/lipase
MLLTPQAMTASRASSLRRRWLVRGGLLLLLAVACVATPLIIATIELERCVRSTDISYADGARRKLDVYRPRGAANAPIIVFFYGGRWLSGTKDWYRLLAGALTARGYIVVVPDYRLYPEVRFPDFLVDGAKALRWTHDNVAILGGDPQRLFVMGHSAGAHIAAMLALDPQWLDGVGLNAARDIAGLIGISGPYDFLPLRDPTLVDIFGGANRADTQPISFAAGHKPPALLVTGDADKVVSPGNSTRLAVRLRHNGNAATEVIYRRLGHMTVLAGFAPLLSSFLPILTDVEAFVARVRPGAPRVVSHVGAATP